MNALNQNSKTNASAAGITDLENKIREMKSVLPFIKNFGARRAVGSTIRRHQRDIVSMKREMFKFNY